MSFPERRDGHVLALAVTPLLVNGEHVSVGKVPDGLARSAIMAVIFAAKFMGLLNRPRLTRRAEGCTSGIAKVKDARSFDDGSVCHAPKVVSLQQVCNSTEKVSTASVWF